MAPPSYSDIGKQARDVFGKGSLRTSKAHLATLAGVYSLCCTWTLSFNYTTLGYSINP